MDETSKRKRRNSTEMENDPNKVVDMEVTASASAYVAASSTEVGNVFAVDATSLPGVLAAVESAAQKNAIDRAEAAGRPELFLESEMALVASLERLGTISTNAQLFPLAVLRGIATLLPPLLAHDNTDVANVVVRIVEEIADPDGVSGKGDAAATLSLISALVNKGQLLPLVVNHLARLAAEPGVVRGMPKDVSTPPGRTPDAEDAAESAYRCMAVLDHLIGWQPLVAGALASVTPLVEVLGNWLRPRRAVAFDENKMYAAELLAVVAASAADPTVAAANAAGDDWLDGILVSLADYRAAAPGSLDAEEEEYVHNCLDALCSLLMASVELNARFVALEGVELLAALVAGKGVARPAALKLLDFALTGSPAAASSLVASGSLGMLFGALLSTKAERAPEREAKAKAKVKSALAGASDQAEADAIQVAAKAAARKRKLALKAYDAEADVEHVVSCLAAALVWLDGLALLRVVHKFTEDGKAGRLATLHARYAERAAAEDARIATIVAPLAPAARAALADDLYIQRLDAGLFTLQRIAVVAGLLHLYAPRLSPDDAATLVDALNRNSLSLARIRPILAEYLEAAGGEAGRGGNDDDDDAAAIDLGARTVRKVAAVMAL
ncbi:nuclear protein NAP [Thecamonas trahens ATCC 50062]|uniref:Nuclear protein NAP n=1 Tax=Thecamonas trahens ATCC 50062 TaxID=461836 RepID=A0A0L0DEI6_THETB|nr:nuclear protein NAP [Thecamonas trahens ATCC 50062]KNC50714.1 nuclear protein NAP [Thecamonas trahens ATCC 50062]|eukprot:XP_013756684.1 nuclear protein NAP [Thecamonas trahens ATCC 50062]